MSLDIGINSHECHRIEKILQDSVNMEKKLKQSNL